VSVPSTPHLSETLEGRTLAVGRRLVETSLDTSNALQLGENLLDGLQSVLETERVALMLVEPDSFEFRVALVRPHSAWPRFERLAQRQIDSGDFARALRHPRPTVVELDRDPWNGDRLVLVPVATGSATPGMGLAVLPPDREVPAAALASAEVLATLLASRLEGRRAREMANHEIAERRRIQEEVDRLNLNLERSIFQLRHLEQLRDDLTRMIVHDLRTPMTSVKTTLDLMTMRQLGAFEPEEFDMVEIANQSADRLLGMVNDLLDISKIEAGELRPELRDVDLHELAETVRGGLEPIARLEDKTVEIAPPEGVTVARADPDLVRRTIENLVGNALRFSRPGSAVTIAIRPAEEGEHLEVAVTDQGEGIPPEYLDRIFQKFVQVEGRRNGRKLGTGLGLTFCRLAAEAQGGRIRVSSEIGEGSTFAVALPVSRA
jgi:signal transduction histidine kinase